MFFNCLQVNSIRKELRTIELQLLSTVNVWVLHKGIYKG